MLRLLVVVLAIGATMTPAWAFAQSAGPCATPRAAADSVFRWQGLKQTDLNKASACLDRKGRSAAQLRESAQRIKLVYDAVGAWVVMKDIPGEADHENDKREAAVTPHADLPAVVIEKRGSQWLWTADSLDHIDFRYDDVGAAIKLAKDLPAVFHSVTFFGVALWQYLALLLLVVTGFVVRKLLAAVVAVRIKKLSEKLGSKWPVKIVDVVASPGATLVTAIILRVGYPQLLLPVAWSQALASVVRVLITISIIWACYRAVDVLAAKLADRAEGTESKLDDQLVPLVSKSLKVMVVLVGAIVVLQNLRFDVTTLFASVSIGGLAIGLAAKDTLANFFGSIMLFVDAPFQIGDWINIKGIDGTVEEVGFRSTRIRTFYNSVVVLPNGGLANQLIDNYGQREFRRCFLTLGLTYDTSPEQMQAFVEGCRGIILSNDFTRKDTYEVHMSGFGGSSLDVMLYFFFRCDTWTIELRERHNVFLEIMRLAQALGVSFAFPTQSLHVESISKTGQRVLPPPPEVAELRASVESFAPKGKSARPAGPVITESGYAAEGTVGRGVDAGEG
jgi:MscS family membrane protein